MASQTAMTLCSSFTPKLATFNSPTPTLLPLPPPRSFSCSSSLPTPRLKASYGGIRVLNTSKFKCYAVSATVTDLVDKSPRVGDWEDLEDVENNEQVQALGLFAVEEHNTAASTNITFIRVVEAERQVVAGYNYRLWIEAEVGKVNKVFKALVFVGLPVYPKELKSFDSVEWLK